ncbi:MAG: hypothetical protein WC708_04015 [Lentisphaeria bacterium]
MATCLFNHRAAPVLCGLAFLAAAAVPAVTVSTPATADTFVLNPGPANTLEDADNRNFGGLNSRSVAAYTAVGTTSGQKGGFDSLLRFNAAATLTAFDALYGAGNWTITGVSLKLCTSYNVAGPGIFNAPGAEGKFAVSYMPDDGSGWVQGQGYTSKTPDPTTSYSGISYTGLQTILDATPATLVGTYDYVNLGTTQWETFDLGTGTQALLVDLLNGDNLSLLLTPADDHVAFNFTSWQYVGTIGSRPPTLIITAEAIPEPVCATLLIMAGGCCLARRAKRR